MNAKTFSLASAIVAISYSLGCFFWFDQRFQGFTALAVGALAALYPLYFQHDRSEALDEARIAQYFADRLPKLARSSVYAERLKSIQQQINGILKGEVAVSFEELARFAERRVSEAVIETAASTYWATHIVDSDEKAHLWSDRTTYPWLNSYVDAQRLVLNSGGEVVRIFLFDVEWLRSHLAEALALARRHDEQR